MKSIRNRHIAFLLVSSLLLGTSVNGFAQGKEEKATEKGVVNSLLDRVSIAGYGTLNYTNYLRHDINRFQKNTIDNERFVLYFNYKMHDKITLRSEFEYEHGGTGVTMEFDPLEEAGEFEMEVEQGGEAKLERLYMDFAIDPRLGVRVGRFKLHMGLASSLDRPTKYFTVLRPEAESELIPLGWYETGVQLYGGFFDNRLRYELSVSSGLDASGFSSRNWIRNGYQTRFEMPIAEAFAYSGRVDWYFGKKRTSFVGLSALINNTTPNRPKLDLENTPGYLKLVAGHVAINESDLRFNASALWGDLQNSDVIAKKNKSLSNSLNVKRTSVGKQAIALSGEIGYNVLPLFGVKRSSEQALYPFFRYDYYDPMFRTAGDVIKNAQWERNVWTLGLNWFVTKGIVFKAEYKDRTYNSEYIDRQTLESMGRKFNDREFSLGMGYSF